MLVRWFCSGQNYFGGYRNRAFWYKALCSQKKPWALC